MQQSLGKWLWLFITNFFGVFNDNFLKNGIIFVAITWALPSWLNYSQLIALVGSSLVLPYLLFSPIGGRLAVRYSKKKVFSLLKLLELPIMAVACVAFYKQWIGLAVAALLLMGTQSCLYSPSKYSLIRDIGGEEGASFGSGMFETMAFVGILLGTFIASVVSDHYSIGLFTSIILGVALLGYIGAKSIRATELPEVKSDASTLNPVKFLRENYLFAKKHRLVNSAVLGASAFWLISNMVQMTTIIHAKNVFAVSNSATGVAMAFAAIGIALGTSLTGRFSGSKVRKGLILPALVGMIACILLIIVVPMTFSVFVDCITLFALIAGVFQVPCMAMMQQADLGRKRGDSIAYLNMMNFIFILIGTALFSAVTALSGENSFFVFGAIAAVCAIVFLYFLLRYPDFRSATKEMVGW